MPNWITRLFRSLKTSNAHLTVAEAATDEGFHALCQELIQTVKPLPKVFGVEWMPIQDRTFQQVKSIQGAYSSGDVISAMVQVCYHRVTAEQITAMNFVLFVRFWRHIHLQLEAINRIEDNIGQHDPDYDSAGVEGLQKYGSMLTVDALAGGDPTKWAEIQSMPYQEVIVKKMMDADLGEFRSRLGKIKSKRK